MSLRLRVKVIPGARQEALEYLGELLRVKVRAAPEKGRANAAVVALVAERLGLPPGGVHVASGHTSALKVLEFSTLTSQELADRLAALRA
ncbi:MAG TPA: DUF167 family protein [Hyphomicrobiales bacterium]|nr:DUF167 family protein [Hyphomicrobiales bacterium]